MIQNDQISFGNRRLVGQKKARHQVEKILRSDRLSHAYLITGPDGSGKTAFALAMAEIVNGVDHYTDLKGTTFSKKSSWYTHPDIHVFMPLPSKVSDEELKTRLGMLAKDPYEIVDFKLRPALTDPESSKNLQAFYSIKYYHDSIRPKTVFKPNEGQRTVIVIMGIDTMNKSSANAFLKLLEEPSENVLFILTASKTDQLLPTIISRCQQIRLQPLAYDEVAEGLARYDEMDGDDARFLARLSGGNYSLARFFEIETLQKTRDELVNFLRYSYTQDAKALQELIKNWNSGLNRENQIALCNTLEQLLRDILVFRETNDRVLITNIDKIQVIEKFCKSMGEARIEEMIEHLQHLKELLYQNVQFKYIFTALSLRFTFLMRGNEPSISKHETWQHLPAYSEM
ncbi:MAG: AAA family ATPase [Balneolaceae bacterium]|nr:AAA family ATPase [Balneolaceae bacterium]